MPLIGYQELPKDFRLLKGYRTWGVRRKLSMLLIPVVISILILTGYMTFTVADSHLNIAIDRSVQLQVMAQAHAIENILEGARRHILTLAAGGTSAEELADFLRTMHELEPGTYSEAGFIGKSSEQDCMLVLGDGAFIDVPRHEISQIRPNPISLARMAHELGPGDVHMSEIARATYMFTERQGTPRTMPAVFRLITPVIDSRGELKGTLLLGLNAQAFRNTLSLYNSPWSPIYAFPRTAERRFSYFFDVQGWMLFQSENVEEGSKDLSTNMARSGFEGDHSLPSLEMAFRPDPKHEFYWSMVVSTKEGQHGIISIDMDTMRVGNAPGHYSLGYAPVSFIARKDGVRQVIGGVAYMDKSRLPGVAEANHFSIMAVIIAAAVLIVGLVIYGAGRLVMEPLRRLEHAVSAMASANTLAEIHLPQQDRETTALKDVINLMIRSLLRQKEELLAKDRRLHDVQLRERAFLTSPGGAEGVSQSIPAIIGNAPAMEELKARIIKAASVEADVLIIGETGTGKELTARAIHQYSPRSGAAFVSVNCGALNEALLLDELFGHVKGAFTEARSDRKGAFLAADGGTLFMDEIGNASAKVQQALLRTLETRHITPLGSDKETAVNVRLIAATNVDLKDLSTKDVFREDLYYRLKVISLETPPLRAHKEDIPRLVNYFLTEASRQMHKPGMGISRGALEKLRRHDWPGNIRELRNCIIRAVAMAEGSILHREDVVFDESPHSHPTAAVGVAGWAAEDDAHGEDSHSQEDNFDSRAYNAQGKTGPAPSRKSVRETPLGEQRPAADGELNERQRRVMQQMQGPISRQDYQNLAGADVPQRTAQHDLQDLVRRGFLRKVGKGPSTRYVA